MTIIYHTTSQQRRVRPNSRVRRVKLVEREVARLRVENDALLVTLAETLGTSMNVAWKIARLTLVKR